MARKPNHKEFIRCVTNSIRTFSERVIAFLYFRIRFVSGKATLQELVSDFEIAGLGKPQSSMLRMMLTKDRRTKRIANDTWIIPSDRFNDVELELHLSKCLKSIVSKKTLVHFIKRQKKNDGVFVDFQRIKELKTIISEKYDLSRLVRMCEEVNDNFSRGNYISVIVLVRTILNHVASIFGFKNFSEVANNYKCEKSLKDSFQHLENSSRKIADGYLHIPARDKEVLPTRTQVNFSQNTDVLLAEVVRILK